MKKLLVGLLAFGSIASFASNGKINCGIYIDSENYSVVPHVTRAHERRSEKVRDQFEARGFTIVSNKSSAEFVAQIKNDCVNSSDFYCDYDNDYENRYIKSSVTIKDSNTDEIFYEGSGKANKSSMVRGDILSVKRALEDLTSCDH